MNRPDWKLLPLLVAIFPTTPILAQHAGHAGHGAPQVQAEKPKDPPVPASHDHSMMNDAAMDHSGMDHGDMEHGSDAPTTASPGPEMETSAPPEAGSGPPRAADAIWGADVMAAARHKEHGKHGNFPVLWVQADRFETHLRQGRDGYLWDVQGYYGGPTNRFWFKSEGEGSFGEKIDDAEIQALWSKAFDPFWDLQLGVRQDLAGPSTTHAVVGVQGLAPYMFEVDAAMFVSHRGDVTAKVEAELEQRVTQRLILQPRAGLGFSAQDIPRLGIGAGIDKIELGVRLRYEIVREFAPYVGVEQSWRLGNSADFARAMGEDPSATNLVVGVRFWF